MQFIELIELLKLGQDSKQELFAILRVRVYLFCDHVFVGSCLQMLFIIIFLSS